MANSTGALGIGSEPLSGIVEGYSLGNRFTTTATDTIVTVQFSRYPGSPFPQKVYLYDVTLGVLAATIIVGSTIWTQINADWWELTVADTGAVMPQMVSGHVYQLIAYMGGANSYQMYGGTATPSTGYGTVGTRYQAAIDTATPTGSSGQAWGIDFTVTAGTPPAGNTGNNGGATGPEVDAALATWLSSTSGTNTHHGDLPWVTSADVATILSRVGVLDSAEAGSRGIPATVGGFLGWLAVNGSNILGTINSLVGDHTIGTSPATFGDLLTAKADILNQMQSYQDQLLTNSAPLGNALANFPGAGWAMTDETDFGSAIHYLQSADLYVCFCTTLPPHLTASLADDVPVYYRLGWWSPMNGSGLRDRRFIDFDAAHLVDAGRRIESCVVQYQPGATGHIQAWTYTP